MKFLAAMQKDTTMQYAFHFPACKSFYERLEKYELVPKFSDLRVFKVNKKDTVASIDVFLTVQSQQERYCSVYRRFPNAFTVGFETYLPTDSLKLSFSPS